MSGSGLRLGGPEAILLDEDVGQDDELPHDGRDGDLRRLAGVAQRRVLRPEVGIAADRGHGGHVEQPSHLLPASYPSGGRVRALQAILRPRDSATRPPKRPEMAVRAVSGLDRAVWGGHELGWLPPSRPETLPKGGSQALAGPRRSSRLAGPSRINSAGSSATTGQRSAAAPATGRKPGVRGGTAPRQPPQGTHGVWPQGVSWLTATNRTRASPEGDRRWLRAPSRAPLCEAQPKNPPACLAKHRRACPRPRSECHERPFGEAARPCRASGYAGRAGVHHRSATVCIDPHCLFPHPRSGTRRQASQ